MAPNANYDAGRARLIPSLPIATSINIPQNRAEGQLGRRMVSEEGDEYVYVRFGAAGVRYDAYMFDETYGGPRADANGYAGTAENGARLITNAPAHGAISGMVGFVQHYAAVKAGQYGWVQVDGPAITKVERDIADAAADMDRITRHGADKTAGALTVRAANAADLYVMGVTIGRLEEATEDDQVQLVRAILTRPTYQVETETAVAAQPDRDPVEHRAGNTGWPATPQQDY